MIAGAMAAQQITLSRELLTLLRRAVYYAFEGGSDFVQPAHLRRAMRDDDTIVRLDDTIMKLEDTLMSRINKSIQHELGQVTQIVATRCRPPEQLHDVDSERVPFPIYRSLLIRTPDGNNGKWLDQDSYNIFLEGARAVRAGAYLPKHLAKAL
jgi:hypothetical protein